MGGASAEPTLLFSLPGLLNIPVKHIALVYLCTGADRLGPLVEYPLPGVTGGTDPKANSNATPTVYFHTNTSHHTGFIRTQIAGSITHIFSI